MNTNIGCLEACSICVLQDILLLAADLCGNYELDNAIIVADSCVRLLKESAQLAAENALRPPEGTQVSFSTTPPFQRCGC